MDSIRVSEALDPRSIRGEATKATLVQFFSEVRHFHFFKGRYGFEVGEYLLFS